MEKQNIKNIYISKISNNFLKQLKITNIISILKRNGNILENILWKN